MDVVQHCAARRRTLLTTLLAAVVLLAGACTSGPSEKSAAREALLAAIAKTEATTFHLGQLPRTPGDSGEADFQPPDRLRTVLQAAPPPARDAGQTVVSGHNGSVTLVEPNASVAGAGGVSISIGRDIYFGDPLGGGFTHTTRPAEQSGAPLTPLTSLRAAAKAGTVRRAGEIFKIALPGTTAMEATVAGGFVVTMRTFSHAKFVVGLTLSRFGEPVSIEAPPASEVHEAENRQPATDLSEDNVTLPAARGDTTTTLQVREVTSSDAATCAGSAENPPPELTATIELREGGCYVTGPSLIEVEHAGARAMRGPSGDLFIQLQLSSSDARAFDAMASSHYGKQLAIVAFGQIISAPTIRSDHFNGKPTITGKITPEYAARLAAALK